MSLPVAPKKTIKPKTIEIKIEKVDGGINDILSSTKLKPNEAVELKNMMLIEDGTPTKGWGTNYYGGDAGGSIVDGWVEYRKADGTRELIIFANGLARRKNGTSWDTISGYTPTAGTPVQALQIGENLYVCNGTDALAKYAGTSFTSYVEIDPPDNLAAALTTLTTGDYTLYAQVTAHNEIGETVGCTEVTQTVNKDRDEWASGEKITWTWDKVADATYYTFYMDTESGYEGKVTDIAQMDNPTFVDDGTMAINSYISPQDANTTGGPKFRYMTVSGNRLWGTGDPDNPWRVYFTGKGIRLGIFSWAYGGGEIDIEKGSKNRAAGIIDFQGLPYIVFSSSYFASRALIQVENDAFFITGGRGSIWSISLTYNSTYDFWDPIPTKTTNLTSGKGVFVFGNEPNVMSTVLRTNELSAKIRNYIQAIPNSDLEKMCAYYTNGKVFFSTPNKTFYYDRERLCWVKDWGFGACLLGEHTETNGTVRFLGGMTTDGYLFDISPSYSGYLGVAFPTKYLSPRFPIDEDWTQFAKMLKTFVRLGNAQGTIKFSVYGTQKSTNFQSLVSKSITRETASSGLGWDLLGSCQLGTSLGTPTTFEDASLIRYAKINKRLRDIQFGVTTAGMADKADILGIIANGTLIKTIPPSSWKM